MCSKIKWNNIYVSTLRYNKFKIEKNEYPYSLTEKGKKLHALGVNMNNYKKILINIFNKYQISTYKIDYYPKMFGNIVCSFQYNDKNYNFVTDRGEIILNGQSINDADYLDRGILTIDLLEKLIIKRINADQKEGWL